jgi:hypothetical protein
VSFIWILGLVPKFSLEFIHKTYESKFLGTERCIQAEINIKHARSILIDRIRECGELWIDVHYDLVHIEDRQVADRCTRDVVDCLFEVQGLQFQVAATLRKPKHHESACDRTLGKFLMRLFLWVVLVSGLVVFMLYLSIRKRGC